MSSNEINHLISLKCGMAESIILSQEISNNASRKLTILGEEIQKFIPHRCGWKICILTVTLKHISIEDMILLVL